MNIEINIYKNRMVLSDSNHTITVTPDEAFTSTRQLVGKFLVAEKCMKKGVIALGAIGLFKTRPVMIVRAMELIEGGLSEIEDRCLRELAYGAGAKEVKID